MLFDYSEQRTRFFLAAKADQMVKIIFKKISEPHTDAQKASVYILPFPIKQLR